MADTKELIADKILDWHKEHPESTFKPGHRNEDGVNISIACALIGENAHKIVHNLWKEHNKIWDLDTAIEVIERCEPYVEKWAKDPCEYMIGTITNRYDIKW